MHRLHLGRSLLLAMAAFLALALPVSEAVAQAKTSAQTTGTPVRGGNLNIATSGDPRSLDPVASPGPLTARYAELLYESLFAPDKNFTPRPMLVQTYTKSADGLKYSFALRDGVTFHDGSPLTAADVVASLNRFFKSDFAGRDVVKDVAALVAQDDKTVVLTLKRPRFPLLLELAAPASQIFPARLLEGLASTGLSQQQAIGTGPYKLKSWTPGQGIVLERYEGYRSRSEEDWGGLAGAKHAYLDTLSFVFVSDPSAQVSGLQSGRWDYLQPNIDQYDILKADRNLVVATLAGANLNTVSMNSSDASIFAKKEAREALSLVMDRPKIVAAKGGNEHITHLSPAFVVRANQLLYSDAGLKQYKTYDPARAKELFAKAGLKADEGIRILAVNNFPWLQQTAVMLQSELQKIGIKATIQSYDWATVTKLIQKNEGWDIEPIFYNAVVTSPAAMRLLKNVWGNSFASPEMDAYLAQFSAATSEAQAKKVFADLQGYLWEQYAYPVIDVTHEYAAFTTRLKGYGNFYHVFWNSWLEKR